MSLLRRLRVSVVHAPPAGHRVLDAPPMLGVAMMAFYLDCGCDCVFSIVTIAGYLALVIWAVTR